ncbi:trypsin-like peptidase domain-containing protein [Sporosarcina sp. HYO08]|uniref:trypsin-like peptidase domain-containing protein n=1 Tax=Sporosarcina sp. HYO08 TaxID=1759557 RepID=UPI0007935BBB|nr:trypsin-like peptidase domain-containing protein [Sporosarcina sp. HYO08]KXH81734.1 hypothetical protein AU377_05575 [Sporosarcina sp. HYO08]
MFCSKCGEKNEATAKFCSNCGKPMPDVRRLFSKGWMVIIAIVCFFLLLGGIGYGFLTVSESQETSTRELHLEGPSETPIEINASEEQSKAIVTSVEEKEKTSIIREAMPKVFTILTTESFGSGFLYKEGGYIITNAHVVAGFTDVTVRNADGKESPGKVIGISDRSDVALIYAAAYQNTQPLQTMQKESPIGTEVIALGSPQGFENSASIGYLTGLNRDLELGFLYEKVYQIDAQIDKGSSGGPLLDAKTGQVIGINSLIYKENNLFGFAIPMYSVEGLIGQWANAPMSSEEVAAVFGVYDSHVYVNHDSDTNERHDEDDDLVVENQSSYVFDDESLTYFVLAFRDFYEMALAYEAFEWIEDMLVPESLAYKEFSQYIDDITGQGMVFDFTNNTVTSIDILDGYASVHTFEEFEFTNTAGEHSLYARNKEYHVVMDENGRYWIRNVLIHE